MLPVGTPNGSRATARRTRTAARTRMAARSFRRGGRRTRRQGDEVSVSLSPCLLVSLSGPSGGWYTMSMRPFIEQNPSLVRLQHGQERLLRDLDRPDLLHPLLAGRLLRQ